MPYVDINRKLGTFFGESTWLRVLFFKLIDLILLRDWYIHKELRRWAQDKTKAHVHILDAGAGFGQNTYFLSRLSRKWSILGIDIKKDEVCHCNKFFHKIGEDNVLFKIEELRTFRQDKAFDLILSVNVMDQIREDCKVFHNFHESLKDNGMLLLTAPSNDRQIVQNKIFTEEVVRKGYDRKEIVKKLKDAGFSKIQFYYGYGKPGQLSWNLSIKIPVILLDISKAFFLLMPFYYLVVYPFCFLLNFWDLNKRHKKGLCVIVKAWK
jgi:SAM-dependent methyltransferase